MTCLLGGGKDDETRQGARNSTTFACRTVRIGSYRFVPKGEVSNQFVFSNTLLNYKELVPVRVTRLLILFVKPKVVKYLVLFGYFYNSIQHISEFNSARFNSISFHLNYCV